jgi:hypothetical protein
MSTTTLPVDPSATLAAVLALAPAARLRPASRAALLAIAEDGLAPDFLEACAEEGNPVNSLAEHLADLVERLTLRLEWNERAPQNERAPDLEALRALRAAAAKLAQEGGAK